MLKKLLSWFKDEGQKEPDLLKETIDSWEGFKPKGYEVFHSLRPIHPISGNIADYTLILRSANHCMETNNRFVLKQNTASDIRERSFFLDHDGEFLTDLEESQRVFKHEVCKFLQLYRRYNDEQVMVTTVLYQVLPVVNNLITLVKELED